jgi:uncharacterized protein (TIGR03086 family)
MSENLRRYTTIVFGLEYVVRQVPASEWENPSPCEGWSARHVAGHAMGVVHNVAARAGLGDVIDVFADVDSIAGDDPLSSLRAIRNRYLAATDRPGALQRQITSRLGEMSLDQFLGAMCSDTLVHTWDIARATGVDETLDPGSVRTVYAGYLAGFPSTAREPGRYGVAIDDAGLESEQDRMIAFTGRDPRR